MGPVAFIYIKPFILEKYLLGMSYIMTLYYHWENYT